MTDARRRPETRVAFRSAVRIVAFCFVMFACPALGAGTGIVPGALPNAPAFPDAIRKALEEELQRLRARIPELEKGIDDYHEKWTALETRIARVYQVLHNWTFENERSDLERLFAAIKPSEESEGEKRDARGCQDQARVEAQDMAG